MNEPLRSIVVLDNKEYARHERVNRVVLGEKGKRLAYLASEEEKPTEWTLYVDKEEIGTYKSVRDMCFSNDEKWFAYAATTDEGWKVIVDDVEGKAYDSIRGLSWIKSKEIGYLAESGGEIFIVTEKIR